MPCATCETRRPRRFCPGVGGDICSLCCGSEREITVDCPLDCEFLQEARKHDRTPGLEQETDPHKDIRISDKFLEDNEPLLIFLGRTLLATALEMPGTVDFDVREALDSLIRTYRTLESGFYYESVPPNPLAANLFRAVQGGVPQYREEEHKRFGVTRTRDADVLGLLVFLSRVERDQNNGRRRGRAFLDGLRGFFAAPAQPAESSPLLLP